MKILIADDDIVTRSMLAAILSKAGHEIQEAGDGRQALRRLQEPNAPQLAILDWIMPEMDGIEVVRQLRQDNGQRQPYLIILTSKTEMSDLSAGLAAGSNDYLSKPFDPQELLARVNVGKRMLELQTKLEKQNTELSLWRSQMEQALRFAGKVQSKILSTKPVFTTEFDVSFAYQPVMSIGGDFFDAITVPDGRLCLYVGDASGHGVAPALFSTFLKMMTSEIIHSNIDAGPASICWSLNHYMHKHNLNTEIFATLFLAVYEPQSRRWKAFNCGHPPPILLGVNGEPRNSCISERGDLPLGISNLPEQYNSEMEIEWQSKPGDFLLLFSDGAYETRHQKTRKSCGPEKIQQLAQKLLKTKLKPEAECLIKMLRQEGYQLDEDDCCIAAVKISIPNDIILKLDVKCQAKAVEQAADKAVETLQQKGWPEFVGTLIWLLIMEYGINIVRHSWPSADNQFQCNLLNYGEYCQLFVKDNCPAWDFTGKLEFYHNNSQYKEHGRGLEIIRRLADKIDFYRVDPYNYTRFLVRRDKSAEIYQQID